MFQIKTTEETKRKGAVMDLIFINKKELVEDVKVEGSLGLP